MSCLPITRLDSGVLLRKICSSCQCYNSIFTRVYSTSTSPLLSWNYSIGQRLAQLVGRGQKSGFLVKLIFVSATFLSGRTVSRAPFPSVLGIGDRLASIPTPSAHSPHFHHSPHLASTPARAPSRSIFGVILYSQGKKSCSRRLWIKHLVQRTEFKRKFCNSFLVFRAPPTPLAPYSEHSTDQDLLHRTTT